MEIKWRATWRTVVGEWLLDDGNEVKDVVIDRFSTPNTTGTRTMK